MLKKIVKAKRISLLYVIIFFVLIMGTTYAVGMYSLALNIGTALISVDESSYGNTTFNSSNLDFKPILDSAVTTSPNNVVKIDFAVGGASTNNNDNIIYDIALVDLVVDCDLLSPYIKWKLIKDGTELTNGSLSYTFDTIDDGRLVLTEIQQDLPAYSANRTGYHKYTFYMWFSDSCQDSNLSSCKGKPDQSALMGKSFSGKVEVELYTESKKQLERKPSATINYSTCGGGKIINYNLDGGTISTDKVVIPGEKYGTLPTPTTSKTINFNVNGGTTVASQTANFTFEGWYSDEALTNEVTSNTIVPTTGDYTLYAKWSGGKITLPTTSKSGSAFEGWYTENTFENKVNNDTVYNKNTTLYARWETTVFTVSYNANGGSGTMNSQSVAKNSTITLLENGFTRTGYKFTGWNTKADGTGTNYTSWIGVEKTWTLETDLQLYAQWEIGTYIVSYNANGGTGTINNQEATYNQSITISSNTFTRTGYKFTGWNTKADGTGTDYTSWIGVSKTWTLETDLQLYAQWEINKVYVKYSVNGGTITSSTTSSSGATTYAWTTDSNGIISMAKNGGTSTDNFYETYEYGGSSSSDGLPNYNNSNYMNITKPGYAAVSGAEWICLSGDCTSGTTYSHAGTIEASALCDASAGDCTAVLGVNWTVKNYTVTFNPNGGTVTTTSKSVTHGSTYGTLPTPTRAGHTFNGWFTSSTGGTKITSSSTVSITANQTLYAQWTAQSYTVTFNPNGGSVTTTSKSVTHGSTYGTLPTPTRTYYTFNGWFTAASGGTKITSSSTVSITANQTLYAQWTAQTLTANAFRYYCTNTYDNYYRLSVFYVTTCKAHESCNYTKVNGLTSSTIDTSMMVFTPTWSLDYNLFSSSISSNCKSTWYVKTNDGTGMNCRAGASTSTDRVAGVAECSAITVSRTTTKYDTNGNNWFYFPGGDCYLAGAYLYTSQKCTSSGGGSTNADPKICGKCSSNSQCGSSMTCTGTCYGYEGTYSCCVKPNQTELCY